jgi:hypothetical protein
VISRHHLGDHPSLTAGHLEISCYRHQAPDNPASPLPIRPWPTSTGSRIAFQITAQGAERYTSLPALAQTITHLIHCNYTTPRYTPCHLDSRFFVFDDTCDHLCRLGSTSRIAGHGLLRFAQSTGRHCTTTQSCGSSRLRGKTALSQCNYTYTGDSGS